MPKATAILIMFLIGLYGSAHSENTVMEKIKTSNNPNPFKLVVFSEGFREGRELRTIYPAAAKPIVKRLFLEAPLDSLAHLFEVYLVYVASADSGVSKPGFPKNTYFGSYWDRTPTLSENGIAKLDDLRYELLPDYDPIRDSSLLLIQDGRFSGGSYPQERLSLAPMWHPLAPIIVNHEVGGHILGYDPANGSILGDETPVPLYDEFYDNFPEWLFPNVTHKTKTELAAIKRADIKWGDLVSKDIDIFPSEWAQKNRLKISLFAIDSTGVKNLYIPSMFCIMRANYSDFCEVCKRQITTAVLKRYLVKFLAADLDRGGAVGQEDFYIFEKTFGSRPSDQNWLRQADFNHDKKIDLKDFFIFASQFGKGVDPSAQKITVKDSMEKQICGFLE